jgi:hypothetical protein
MSVTVRVNQARFIDDVMCGDRGGAGWGGRNVYWPLVQLVFSISLYSCCVVF